MALSQIRIFDIKPSDIVAQFASICFDASLSEIMMALLAGASLMIFHSPEERTGSKLIDTLNLFSITVITLPPSLLSALDPQKLLCIRTIISAGEPCPTVLAYKWTNSSRHFFNAYGPSEAAVCATIYEYDLTTAAQLAKYKTLPIGTPIHNIRTRVVDSQLNDVPVGMPGELLLSGMGVSRKGYIGTINEKNNKAFVTLNQERWYRTGDLVTTIGPDHQMFIYFGRMDNQVKLSGCRIELNEIEAAVLTCPGVTHCIVVLHQCEKCDDDHGALAAYVDGTATTDFIQEHIIQKLPTYMLPTYMIIHSSFFLPTTLSGKVNRQLLATDQNVHCRHTNKTPLTSTEQHMYMLWCQILNKEYDINMVVDPNDLTFAQCGGNSLTIALLHALLVTQFSINARVYAHMSLKQMANLLVQQNDKVDDIFYEAIMHDLNNDTIDLNDVVHSSHSRVLDQTSSILLTGATGFLGCFLLNELLTTTSMTIIVLIRALSLDAAKRRLCLTLLKYDLLSEIVQQAFDNNGQKRIEICLCENLADYDESFSHLDLNNRWNHIDAVLHCAADTNFNLTYEHLRQVNVQLTKYLLGQCVRHNIPIYHVSSLSIFLFTQHDMTLPPSYINETDEPQLRSIIGGYSQSKYVADMLVLRALRRGLPGAIFRPGRVTGSSISGIGSTEDLFILMLRGCHELGAYPKLKFPYDVTPVDMVSKAIVRIITRPQSFANSIPLIVHLINTKTIPFDEQFKLLNQFSCRTNHLEELPYNEWCKRLIDRVSVEQRQSNTFNPLLPLIPFLQSSFWQHIEQWPVFTRTNDADAVMDMCPEKLFKLYCRVWKRAGWFT
ncbi:unnamed protein product [Rotaria sp. Silwood1]|nr:unnamed protein product [Rotaria sp. Silwood1]